MPGETGAPAKIKFVEGTDEVKNFPSEVSKPSAEEINTFLKAHTLFLKTRESSYEATSGEFGEIETTGITVTLPSAATANQLIGVFLGSAATEAKITTSGGALIYGDFVTGEATIKLLTLQHVILQSDATNWLIIAGEPKREHTYGAKTDRLYNKAYTPSATRPVFVSLEMESENVAPIIEAKIKVGGVEISKVAIVALTGKSEGGSIVFPASFYCPPGVSWEVEAGGFANLFSTYLTL